MGLASNSNLSAKEILAPEDIKQIIKDTLRDEIRADEIMDTRAREQAKSDDDRALEVARAKSAEMGQKAAAASVYTGSRDRLAVKDPDEMDAAEKALVFARGLQCQYRAWKSNRSIIDVAKAHGQESLVHMIKSVQATDFDSGGFLLPSTMSMAVIAELVAKSVYLRAGPRTLDLPEGGLSIPYISDGADAQWAAEGTEVSAEEVTGGRINLQARKLITVVGVSNDMLRGPVGSNGQYILDTIVDGIQTKLDGTLINSDGSESEPKGLDGLLSSSNYFSVTAESGLTQAILVQELLYMQTLCEQNNIDMATANPFYFMSPRTKNFLRAQIATDGRLFPEMDRGMLQGAGYDATSNVLNTISSTYSEIFFVCLAHMLLGKQEGMIVDMFDGGTYNNSSGTKRSGISADETAVRVISKWDHAAGQRGNEIARADDVDWQ